METRSFGDNQNVGKYAKEHIRISIDLVEQTSKHLYFLRCVDKHPNLYTEKVVKNSIWRYEHLWLPLVEKTIETYIVPPLDIHWIWHCHMLAPVNYENDCKRLFETVPDHRFLTEEQYKLKLQETRILWTTYYPNEPFELDVDKDDMEFLDRQEESKFGYNLEAAISRQQQFYYQVSLPHYTDVNFLQNAVSRYKKFLFLKKKNPSQFLVPCYDVDLIWHSHQLHPLMYKVDTETVLGKMLNHDDSVNDRSAGAKLDQSNMVTRQLWKETFGEDFAISGGMYRGKNVAVSDPTLHKISDQQMKSIATTRAKVTLEIMGVDPADKNLKLMVYIHHNTGQRVKVLTCKSPFNGRQAHKATFDVCTSKHSDLVFRVYESSGMFCLSAEDFAGEGSFPLGHNIEQKTEETYQQTVFTSANLQTVVSYAPEIEIIVTMIYKRGPSVLNLKPGKFKTKNENILSIWGPIQLPNMSDGVSLNCCVAKHMIANHLDNDQFICRVVHSIPMMMSGVQVLVGEKMVASSHLIGSDQLPSPEQMHPCSVVPTLDVKHGERTMLVKDHLGDWAIITGQWLGFKHGIPERQGFRGMDETPAVPGNPGYFLVKYFNLRSRAVIKRTLYKDKSFTCHLGDVVFDMESGDIQIDAETDDIVQNTCLAFSVAVLQALCQPQLVRNQPGTSRSQSNPYSSHRSVKPIKRIEVEKLALVMAGGYMQEIPSNSYMKSTGSVGGGSAGCCDGGDPGGCGGCGASAGSGGCCGYDSD